MPPPATESPPPSHLPFPAGPLLRPATQCANALAANDLQRKRLALELLHREEERVEDQKHRISKLTALIAESGLLHAVIEHGPDAVQDAEVHPAAAELHRWLVTVGDRDPACLALCSGAVAEFRKRLQERWNRARDKPVWLLVRDTVETRALTEDGAGALRDKHPAVRITTLPAPSAAGIAGQETLDHVLAAPGGGWRLLGCLFLKLLHAQLAWLPEEKHKPHLKKALYDPALLLLHRTARGNTDMARTAVGLVLTLPQIAPYWMPVQDGAWMPSELPACFLPRQLDAPATSIRQARLLLQHLPGLARQVDPVQALALNVAAQLHDLATEPSLGLAAEQHASRASHLQSSGKRWERALKTGDDAELAKLRASKDFAREALLPRMGLLRTFETWMAKQGCQMAHDAARAAALPLLFTPAQPVPARPAAGDSA